ncbi:MAG: ABC transporter permease subunit [Peptococcaceae bacterium]|nr:ABC transporter permease subunit [Peptococcaceae bacterium]
MPTSSSKNRDYLYTFLGVLTIVVGWQLLSMHYNRVLIPSPADTLRALFDIYSSGELIENLKISFNRQLIGLAVGTILGLVTGIMAGINRKLELIIQPLTRLLLAVPAIVFVVMAMVWFGMGSTMAIFLVSLLVYPIMHVNTVQGFKSIDSKLLEMGKVYRLPGIIKVKKIYLPGLTYSVVAGFSLATASSVRLTVMAELLGAREGIGQKIAISRAYLQIDNLFAWVLVLILIIVLLEWFIIRPLNKFSARWKENYQ